MGPKGVFTTLLSFSRVESSVFTEEDRGSGTFPKGVSIIFVPDPSGAFSPLGGSGRVSAAVPNGVLVIFPSDWADGFFVAEDPNGDPDCFSVADVFPSSDLEQPAINAPDTVIIAITISMNPLLFIPIFPNDSIPPIQWRPIPSGRPERSFIVYAHSRSKNKKPAYQQAGLL